MTLSPLICAVCAAHFGQVKLIRGKRALVDNRCDKCPLRAPCLAFGATPTPTLDALNQARAVFVAEAQRIVGESEEAANARAKGGGK